MNKKAEIKKTSLLDSVKWVFVVVLTLAAVWANHHYSQIDWALRFAGWIVLLSFLFFVSSQTNLGKILWRFSSEARRELRKVVWPSRQETIQTTLIVVVMVIIMALVLWSLDTLFLWVVSLLTRQ